MDRDDARFVADALESRISGDRDALDRLAASSLMRLSTLATRIRKLGDSWEPAHCAAAELMLICRDGGALCATDPSTSLQVFVDKMRELADEAPRTIANRHERRMYAANLPRAKRRAIVAGLASRIVH